jgi:integrase
MATVTKRGRGYQVKIRKIDPCGKFQQISRVFQLRRDADRWARETEASIDRGDFGKITERMWLSLVEDYLTAYCDSSEKVRAKDVAARRKHLFEFWSEVIGDKHVSQITAHDLLKGQAKVDNGSRAASTVNKYVFSMQSFLSWCESQRLINSAPRISQRTQAPNRIRWLKKETELPVFIQALDQVKDPQFKAFLSLAFYTGCRAGELRSLSWQDVDFKEGTILFRKTKNNTDRLVGISSALAALTDHFEQLPMNGFERVFVNANGSIPYNYQRYWDRFCKQIALEDFRFHDLRHNAASYLVMNSVPVAEVAALLGHSNIQTTMRYAHLDPSHNKETVNKLANAFLL